MKPINQTISFAIIALLICSSVNAQKNIFTQSDSVKTASDSSILYSVNIKIEAARLSSANNETFKISLPVQLNKLGSPVTIVKKSGTENKLKNIYTWSGEISEQQGSYVLFTIKGNKLVGYIRTRTGEVYKIEPLSDEVHQISRISPYFSRPDGILALPLNSTSDRLMTERNCCDSFTIDVLVVYTTEAKDSARGTDGIELLISQCETLTNQSFIDSRVHYRINIVSTKETSYSESGSAIVDLPLLINKTDGVLDDIHTTREDTKADVVIMLIENSDRYWGYSTTLTDLNLSFRDYAFSVVKRSVAFSNLIFTHELGHLLGARHDYSVSETPSSFINNHGYGTFNFRTIMSISAHQEYSVGYWSNPDVIYPASGEPTGNINSDFRANNAYTLNRTMPFVSRYQCSEYCDQPVSILKKRWFWLIVLTVLITGYFVFRYIRNRRQ
jgi:peptidyl-Asp metalloendopeptidase